MRIERTKNAAKNMIFGIILKVYQIIVPFLMRTALIYCLGVEYLGLNSLFTSVLQVLNLAELGVGSAMVFSMYNPIAKDDTKTICALMKLYKIYYRVIGLFILILGIILCPFIPYLIKSDLPADINMYTLYLLNLGATVLSYWLFAYKNSLLEAHQRIDVYSKISLVINTLQYIVQFLVIFIFKNYYLYVIVVLIFQIINNMVTAFIVDKMYPNYQPEGELSKVEIAEINQRVKDLFTSKIGGVIVNSSDSIVISAFLGLTVLAIYQNYFYILSAIIGFVGVIFNSCTAGIGNSLIVESEEKNYKDLNKFTFIIMWISCVCTCAFLCLYQTFMIIWVGEDLLLNFSAVICFCCYFYVYEINCLLNLYKDAAGIWHADRFRPLVTALSNLAMNLILVNFIGIYGVLLSTVLSMIFIGMPWLLHNLFTEIFKTNPKNYIVKLLKYAILTSIIAIITYYISNFVNGISIYSLIAKAIICFFVSNVLLYIFYGHTQEMNEAKELMMKILKLKNKKKEV